MHLIPAGGRQDDVRVHGTGGHPEFQSDEEIEFSFGSWIPPLYFLRPAGTFVVEYGIFHAQEMFEKIFVSLAAGPQKICPPEKKHPGKIIRVIGILRCKAESSVFQLFKGMSHD
ncbi:MAG: hypothetical protein ACD_75C00270G0008, partial [uncultured bacterium]